MGCKRLIKGLGLFLAGLFLIFGASAIAPQVAVSQDVSVPEVIDVDPNITQTDTDDRESIPVIVDGTTLFSIHQPLGLSTAEERAQQITDRILAVARDSDISLNDFKVVEQAGMTVVYGGPNLIVRVTDADGAAVNVDRQVLANSYLEQVRTAVDRYREERQSGYLTQAILSSLAATLAFVILVIFVSFIFSQIIKSLINWRDRARQRQQRTVFWIFSPQVIGDVSVDFLRTLRSFIIFGLLLLYVPALFSFFPWTKSWGVRFWEYFFETLDNVKDAAIEYLPNLFNVVFVLFITHYILRSIKLVFNEIAKGEITIAGFYPDWANPTYRIIELAIIAFAAILVVPYLPGYGSPAFQGVSVFLGVLLSLGSTAALANAFSGIILIYTRAFQVGDRVIITDIEGDVEEKQLLVTRVRRDDNVIVTIPNSTLLSNNILNYSTSIRLDRQPVRLQVNVTLGYDVPWENVYNALSEAARRTPRIANNPAPLIIQEGLLDFAVDYAVLVYTNQPSDTEYIHSDLYQNIQDACNEAGIEILSPHYHSMRDGNTSTIPEAYHPEDYTPPGFLVNPLGNLFQIDLKLGNNGRQGNDSGSTSQTPQRPESGSKSS